MYLLFKIVPPTHRVYKKQEDFVVIGWLVTPPIDDRLFFRNNSLDKHLFWKNKLELTVRKLEHFVWFSFFGHSYMQVAFFMDYHQKDFILWRDPHLQYFYVTAKNYNYIVSAMLRLQMLCWNCQQSIYQKNPWSAKIFRGPLDNGSLDLMYDNKANIPISLIRIRFFFSIWF